MDEKDEDWHEWNGRCVLYLIVARIILLLLLCARWDSGGSAFKFADSSGCVYQAPRTGLVCEHGKYPPPPPVTSVRGRFYPRHSLLDTLRSQVSSPPSSRPRLLVGCHLYRA